VINLTSKALSDVEDAEALIKIKTIIALFIQTMEVRLAFKSNNRVHCQELY
jgi:hypothetical protein